MSYRETVESIRNEFLSIIEEKNSWGKRELELVIEKAISNHFISMQDNASRIKDTSLKVISSKKVKNQNENDVRPKALKRRRRNV